MHASPYQRMRKLEPMVENPAEKIAIPALPKYCQWKKATKKKTDNNQNKMCVNIVQVFSDGENLMTWSQIPRTGHFMGGPLAEWYEVAEQMRKDLCWNVHFAYTIFKTLVSKTHTPFGLTRLLHDISEENIEILMGISFMGWTKGFEYLHHWLEVVWSGTDCSDCM